MFKKLMVLVLLFGSLLNVTVARADSSPDAMYYAWSQLWACQRNPTNGPFQFWSGMWCAATFTYCRCKGIDPVTLAEATFPTCVADLAKREANVAAIAAFKDMWWWYGNYYVNRWAYYGAVCSYLNAAATALRVAQ